MIIELGNHCAAQESLDDQPKITSIHVPEADEFGLGGYTHKVEGISPAEVKDHLLDAVLMRDRITQLPDHEILVSLLHPSDGVWKQHGTDKPAWVKVTPHDLTPSDRSEDIQRFLSQYYGCQEAQEFFGTSDPEELLIKKELRYWTRTAPGELGAGLSLPPATALYTNDGRVQDNISNGGGKVGATGQASASSATTLTTASTYTTNEWAGYRVYATVSATVMVWGNVVSNTNASNASVLTVDRWYASATPGGAAGTTPSATATFMIADGGSTAGWFVGLATGANVLAASDHSLSTNGNTEITTGGGGLVRKIAPYAQTSGVASRAYTLTPVFTANGSDSLPATVTTIGVFLSMVTTYSQAGGPMKWETALNATATLSASGDQLTVTETVTGS